MGFKEFDGCFTQDFVELKIKNKNRFGKIFTEKKIPKQHKHN